MTLEANNESNSNLYMTIHQEYKILAEYKMIQSENIEGVYVIPSASTSFLWFGVIFIREGVYTDGIFRFNISLPKQFPNTTEPPSVTFQSTIVHPLICPETGSLNISDTFYDWQTNNYHIWQLLKYIQFCLINTIACATAIATNSKIPNQTAFDLVEQNRTEFVAKAKECVRKSKIEIYDPPATKDKHYIVFEQFDDSVHGPILDSIKNKTDVSISPPTSGGGGGLSWVNQGEFKALSK